MRAAVARRGGRVLRGRYVKPAKNRRSAGAIDALCTLPPVLLTAMFVYIALHSSAIGLADFRHELWPAAHRLLNGASLYGRDWQHISQAVAFPYPPTTAVAFLPLALLPRTAAGMLYLVVNLAAIPATLAVLRVRDRRLYGVVLLWAPVVAGWQSGNLSLLLGLGIACLWRERDRPVVAGVLVAAMISLKPFIWPLGLWLLLTRRWSAARCAAVFALLFNLVAWALVGFSQIDAYRRLTASVAHAMYRHSYTILNLGLHLGLGQAVAYALAITAAMATAALCVVVALRRDERSVLALCIALAMLATPVVWSHYFALMLIPLALTHPRLGPLWLLPIALWMCPAGSGAAWQITLLLAVNAVLIGAAIKRPAEVTRLQLAGVRSALDPVPPATAAAVYQR